MSNLINYINDDELHDVDYLVKLAIIHYQFESIHPFYDGNGRVGRILNILYLVLKGLQDYPILYLSRYIIRHKSEYYRLLQTVRTQNDWESWILYILNGVEEVSRQSIKLIQSIRRLMQEYKFHIRDTYPSFYSHELLNNLFKHPYTKIELLEEDLGCERRTAAKYLNALAEDNKQILQKFKIGRVNYYINTRLFNLFLSVD